MCSRFLIAMHHKMVDLSDRRRCKASKPMFQQQDRVFVVLWFPLSICACCVQQAPSKRPSHKRCQKCVHDSSLRCTRYNNA
eukprot:1160813-Pelagomonas_calceolata.AAC.7